MPFRIAGKMTGLAGVLANLQKIASQTTRSKILRKAVTAAARPMLQQAKATVAVKEGWLKRSLGVRIQTYRQTGVVVAIIGPRTGFQWKKIEGFRRKVHTAFGTKLQAKASKMVRSKKTGLLRQVWQRPTKYGPLVEKVEPFLGPTFTNLKSAAEETMRRVILEGIQSELK